MNKCDSTLCVLLSNFGIDFTSNYFSTPQFLHKIPLMKRIKIYILKWEMFARKINKKWRIKVENIKTTIHA